MYIYVNIEKRGDLDQTLKYDLKILDVCVDFDMHLCFGGAKLRYWVGLVLRMQIQHTNKSFAIVEIESNPKQVG